MLVKDIYPGDAWHMESLTNVNGTLFFVASDGIHGRELWKSDGTAAGTVMVKDIYPGAEESYPQDLVNEGGVLYFTAHSPLSGRELWRSDGTSSGTVLVADIQPGSLASSPDNLTVSGDALYFTAADVFTGRELWLLPLNQTGPFGNAPTADDDAYFTTEDRAITIGATGVLGNDADMDSDPLTAVLVDGPQHGSVALQPDGSFVYTPNGDYSGQDSFTYKANDGTFDSSPATVSITIIPVANRRITHGSADASHEVRNRGRSG